MRSHAKASTAGSTQRQAKGPGGLFVLPASVFVAILASMALLAAPASASKTHAFKEVFGSAAQPSFFEPPRGVAIDQSSGDVLVMDGGGNAIRRFKPDGTPDNFSALGTNAIDGQGSGDETPQDGLGFAAPNESQIAIDNSGTATDGNIYVTQSSPNLINVFSDTGAYLGQLTAAGVAGDFSEACGVAVDSTGAVYVGDYGSGIHKFLPSANPPVNADHVATFTSTSTPCTLAAGAGPSAGFLFPVQYNGPLSKIDSSTGELKYTVSSDPHATVAVDPGNGHVFGGTTDFGTGDSRVNEFDASGAGSATGVSTTKMIESGTPGSDDGFVRSIAIRGASGDIFLSRRPTSKVEVFNGALVTLPDVLTTDATNNTGTRATLNGTVNPDGVELSECKFEWVEADFTPASYAHTVPCAETPAAIGTGTGPVPVHADISGLQPNGATYHFRLLAANPAGTPTGLNDRKFDTPDTVITTAPTALTASTATLNGTVNPDTVALTECIFEWGETTSYGEVAPCVPNAAGIGSGTSPVAVQADLSGLDMATVYHYRLKAANANGPILASDETLQSAGPLIGATWSEDVVITEALLKAEINPEGAATTFHFEYGTSEAYGQQTPELNVGSDSAVHEVSRFLDDLQPGTAYHYRVVATSADGVNEGPDRTLRTFRTPVLETDCPNQAFRVGASALLPDCRAYEMVSPLDKNNGDIVARGEIFSQKPAVLEQSSTSGERLAYGSYRAFGDAESGTYTSQYIAARGAGGWSSHGISPLRTTPIYSAIPYSEFKAFSPDLCQSWLTNFSEPRLTEDSIAGYSNLYRRQDDECGGEEHEALTTVQPPNQTPEGFRVQLQGLSADASHVIYAANDKLTPDAPDTLFGQSQVYEWVGGQLRYVCVLPSGISAADCSAGAWSYQPLNLANKVNQLDNAISADGSRIFWSATSAGIYVRIDGQETVAVSQAAEEEAGTTSSRYWTAAQDGSKAVFTTGVNPNNENLYEFDVDSETTHLIAGRTVGVMGASEDASRIYFVSGEVLDAGATEGGMNLYLYDTAEGGGDFSFITALAPQDAGDTESPVIAIEPRKHTARVAPDGLHAAFVSVASLTGYDNTDVESGNPTSQVYRYDAAANGGAGELVCASCNPSGQRPKGKASGTPTLSGYLTPPTTSLYAPRVLSDDGTRLFFNSFDSLTPRDANGRIDVYQWEALGAGGCDEGDASFVASAAGCVELISSGKSVRDSEFVDASPSGEDVFINTLSGLLPQDYGLRDIYDARAQGGFPLPPSPPDCVGDACQSIPAAPNDPTPASASFRGAGDPQPRKAQRRRCRARGRKGAKGSKAKQKKAKRCRRNNRRAGR